MLTDCRVADYTHYRKHDHDYETTCTSLLLNRLELGIHFNIILV